MSYTLSPSSLNLFLDCKRCFWLSVVKKIKRPDSAFPSLPGGMDRVLKIHFDSFMEQGKLPPELRNNGINDYHLFDDKELLKAWRNNRKGLQYADDSGVVLRGAVDNILVKDGKLVVLDFKTRGYPLKEDTHKHYELQMHLYTLLLRKNGFKTEDYAYLLFYYPNRVLESGAVLFDTHLKKVEVDVEKGEKVFKDAVALLLKEEPPEPNGECSYCHWARGVCGE